MDLERAVEILKEYGCLFPHCGGEDEAIEIAVQAIEEKIERESSPGPDSAALSQALKALNNDYSILARALESAINDIVELGEFSGYKNDTTQFDVPACDFELMTSFIEKLGPRKGFLSYYMTIAKQ